MGRSNDPKMVVRPGEVDITNINGIEMIIANNKGVSVFNKEGIEKSNMTGWVWCFNVGTQPVPGLKFVNDKPNHYNIAPAKNMPVDKFKGLIQEMGLKAIKVHKKLPNGSIQLAK